MPRPNNIRSRQNQPTAGALIAAWPSPSRQCKDQEWPPDDWQGLVLVILGAGRQPASLLLMVAGGRGVMRHGSITAVAAPPKGNVEYSTRSSTVDLESGTQVHHTATAPPTSNPHVPTSGPTPKTSASKNPSPHALPANMALTSHTLRSID
ncbi:uncharacterized protein MAM_02244 [Metarhizium album ARSEF 1941]|uniref:Uncharacterized protein n=1 Tax=Metarhizium album (strain ARSEF 1941) TaxID=1081103 RepID=A0A0B2X4V4_METAS|nr:uncharacterized protein MAM_02244 [Metarhizium album ARSEF 1941]KHO00321.1 hypothetical protein MAM_02244 [Metarhizium album ARSEF 1941]